jgi:hypothetical protein
MSLARTLLERAETLDGYRTIVEASDPNRRAREGDRYIPFLVPPAEAELVRSTMDSISLLDGCDILILHPSADSGMPHTRPKSLICLPSSAVKGEDELLETLRHEAIHIHQRKYPSLWISAVQKEGWMPVEGEQIPLELRRNCRINPDTMSSPFWAWQGAYVPLPLFVKKPAIRLSDVVIKWFDLRSADLHSQPPPSFSARYGPSPPQPEHPYELLAVEFAAQGIQTQADLVAKLRTE